MGKNGRENGNGSNGCDFSIRGGTRVLVSLNLAVRPEGPMTNPGDRVNAVVVGNQIHDLAELGRSAMAKGQIPTRRK